jgi:hypothetical protein
MTSPSPDSARSTAAMVSGRIPLGVRVVRARGVGSGFDGDGRPLRAAGETWRILVEGCGVGLGGDVDPSLEFLRGASFWLLVVCESDARHPVPVTGVASRSPRQAGKSDAMRL